MQSQLQTVNKDRSRPEESIKKMFKEIKLSIFEKKTMYNVCIK